MKAWWECILLFLWWHVLQSPLPQGCHSTPDPGAGSAFTSTNSRRLAAGLRAVTEVHLAAAAGDVAGIKDALEAAPRGCFLCPKDPANEQDAGGNTPLMLATKV